MSLLKISGTKIVNEQGNEVVLRGAGLGGWMKCVNSLFFESKCHADPDPFITQYGKLYIWSVKEANIDFVVTNQCMCRVPWLRIPDTRSPRGDYWGGEV